VHVHDKWFVGNDLKIGDHNAFEFICAGLDDGGAFVDLGGVEQVKNGDMLDGQDFIHAFEAESALAIEEVRDMGLAESGLVRQVEAREIALVDTLAERLAEIVLQSPEFHGRSIAYASIAK